MKRMLSGPFSTIAAVAALSFAGMTPVAAQDMADDDAYEEEDEGMDLGWLGLLGLLGLLGMRKRPDDHRHVHTTTTHTPPPRV